MIPVSSQLDKGITRSLKCFYRKCSETRLVFDVNRRRSPAIDVKTTLEMLYGSWNDARQSTMRNSFVGAGLVPPADEVQPKDPTESLAEAAWHRVTLPNVSFEDFVSADNNLVVAPEITDQEIVDRVVFPDDNNSKDDTEEPPDTSADAADMAPKLRNHLEKLPTVKTAEVKKMH